MPAKTPATPRVRSFEKIGALFPALAKSVGKADMERLADDLDKQCFSHEVLTRIPAELTADGVELFVMGQMWTDMGSDSRSEVLGVQNLTRVVLRRHEQAGNQSATVLVYRRNGDGVPAILVEGKNGEDDLYATLYTI